MAEVLQISCPVCASAWDINFDQLLPFHMHILLEEGCTECHTRKLDLECDGAVVMLREVEDARGG